MPDLRDREAWLLPATEEQAAAAAAVAVGFVYDEVEPGRVRDLAPAFRDRYTAGELAWAIRELRYDEKLDEKRRYRADLTPADFERVINDRHRLIRMLEMKLTMREIKELVKRWPRDLEMRDFACCGYDDFNHPVFVFLKARSERFVEPAQFEVLG